MFSAYTIKKVLPRLVIAVIAIQLSWWLCIAAIQLNNAIAHGIEGLLYAPFGGAKGVGLVNSLATTGAAGVGAAATSGVAIGSIAAVGIAAGPGTVIGLLAMAGTALLGALIALFLLVLRRVVIVFLVLTAPIAIIAWVLPGTQKLWKLWWESFMKLLLVYPMILGLIAAGKIAAYVTSQTSENSFLAFFIIVICYFGPFFLIPALLKLSGAAFATITGAVNNRSKGAFDRLRNVRANEAKKNKARFLAGSRYSERNALGRRVNRIGQGVGVGARGRFGLGQTGREAVDLSMQAKADEALKNDPMLQKLAFNDDGNAVLALSGGSRAGAEAAARDLFTDEHGNYDEARANRALAAASAVGFSRQNAQAAMNTLAQNKARAVASGARGRAQVQAGINRLLSGDATGATAGNAGQADNLRSSFAYNASGAGRGDLGGTDWHAHSDSGVGTASLAGFERTGLYQAANGHQSGVSGATDDAVNLLGTGDVEDATRAAIHYEELGAMLPNASGAVRDEILESRRRLEAAGVRTVMGQQVIDPATGAPLQETRRVAYDNNDPTHATWSAADRTRGWRNETVDVTLGDRARAQARTYERPDPNHI